MRNVQWLSLVFLLNVFSCLPVLAQTEEPVADPEPNSIEAESYKAKRDSLVSVIIAIRNVKESLQKVYTQKNKNEIPSGEAVELESKLNSLQRNFTEIASGVDISIISQEQPAESMDWSKELQKLLQPLLNEIRRVTSKPREIDHIRTVIEDLKLKISTTNAALKNIKKLIAVSENQILIEKLNDEEGKWTNQLQQLNTQLVINEQKLEQRLRERKSVFETVESLPDLFFKSRGRNFIISILTVIIFWLLVNYAWRVLQKKGPLHPDQRTIKARIFYVSYLFFRGIGSFFIFMLALFILGDWVLLILAVLLALGIIWTSKQLMLRFWTQTTILLNMGAVREGERVDYKNLPWKVRSLNFYSILENPALDSGMIRIPLKDMEELRSRAYDEHEPWFPSHNGDWVILDDGTYGKIIWQGINNVRLKELGGATKTYNTDSYIALNPKSLTPGFRIKVTFGIDYAHQKISTNEVPSIFNQELTRELINSGYDNLFSLQVEFEEAAASSLNIAILADFKGELAPKYQSLRRLINKICVEVCNKNEWIIPFQQVTVHMPPGENLK